jgi:RNA methyltransferase, TrmH family
VATVTGAHADRIGRARDLLSVKGRREHGRFSFEGPTLLDEALRSNVAIEELYVTQRVLDANEAVAKLDADGFPVYLVDERTLDKLSDLETPTGLVAVAPLPVTPLARLLEHPLVLVLAEINDPGNAGTLLRSAEAFGAGGVVFGRLGVDPFHPKVVRAAMGAIFRLGLAVADPATLRAASKASGTEVLGLEADAPDIQASPRAQRTALVIGHERRGLGDWEALCARKVGIPMADSAESLNASVAGSIALYELSRQAVKRAPGA